MPHISRSALVPYSASKMYRLVNDVASYPDFLSGCTGSDILESSHHIMVAKINIAKMGMNKSFTTRNTLVENSSIDIQLIDGPFRALDGGWLFTPIASDACKVTLNLDFTFSNKLIELAFGHIFNELMSNMVQAFTLRAKEVYRG